MGAERSGSSFILHPSSFRHRSGFTLIELLVVLAITAILMVIMFVPLSRAIDMVRRGEAQTKGQDSVRTAARRIARELNEAVQVFEPRPLQVWGFNAWSFSGGVGVPANAAVPEGYVIPNGVLSMRLPKKRYYDTANAHYVTPADLNMGATGLSYDSVALAACPIHGSPVELRPLQPVEPDDRIVAYFVGLKEPGYPNDGATPPNRIANPTYNNLYLFGKTFGNQPNLLNTYVLYRVEFRLGDPLFANWNLQNGAPNPGFFYDTALAANGLPYWQNWRNLVVSQMDANTGDAVRWLEEGGKYVPKPLCTFNASPTDEVVASPNRSPGTYLLGGGHLPGNLPPLEYTAPDAHWGGFQRDAAYPWPGNWTMTPGGGTFAGPRITVANEYFPLPGPPPDPLVFDTGSANRARLVSFDSVKGRVITAFRRWDYSAGATVYAEHYSAPVNQSTATAQLIGDVQTGPAVAPMPSSFGACKAVPALAGTTLIVPGSEVLMLVTNPAAGDPPGGYGEQMRRVAWSGLPAGLNQDYAAQNELDLDEYKIDYSTGEITLSTKDLSFWSNFGTGAGQKQLLVRYRFQTNRPDDVVRVSYTTNEILAMNLGIVEFTRRRAEFIPYEVSERVVVRNLKR